MFSLSSAHARSLAFGLAVAALVAVASVSAQPRRGENAPDNQLTPRADYQPVRVPLGEGIDALSPEEKRLVELRGELRELRTKRRAAMREARSSGDDVALQAAMDEYRTQMDVLRQQLREARGVVLEQQLGSSDLPDALMEGADDASRPCEAGSGRASDAFRRRAFERLVALDPSLQQPSDIPTPVREELTAHARRAALLRCIRFQARAAGDEPSATRVRGLLIKEQRRHDAALRALFGAAAPAPTATSSEEEAAQ